MKAIGETVTIRLRWNGPAEAFPKVGDVLQTRTGRSYEIESARGAVLTCRILPPHSKSETGATYRFWWNR